MSNVVTLQNVEGAVIGILAAAVDSGVVIGTSVPNPRPPRHVRVGRVGGAVITLVQERPTLLIECWAEKRLAAWGLAAQCHSALAGRDTLVFNGIEIYNRDLSSPVNYPDPSTALPRYQFTMTATVDMEGPL